MKTEDINIRDPFVLLKNGVYYLYGTRASSFGIETGGFDVYKSNDLKIWSEPSEVFNSDAFGLNRGANWAPEVHFYNGNYYMFATFTRVNGLRGTHILVSSTPDGRFTPLTGEAITPFDWECLDGTFFVEDGKAYCVFCHEHTQVLDGEICYIELSDDLKNAVTEPKPMFKASSFLKREATEKCHNFTDGPFLYRKKDGTLLMLWSTCGDGYIQCIAVSDNGKISGEWSHLEPLFKDDGGHGMLFHDVSGKLRLTLHCPNVKDKEKPVFFTLLETATSLEIEK